MHAITTTSTNIKQFKQPDPLLVIERLMQQMVDSGQAVYVTLILTEDDGRQTEIEIKAPRQ